ncbi:MAG: hypothetical protein WC979_00290 [Candidatus Pacearchaeota archaeon]|jgi:glycerol-3-phosphate acyltransferase PlsY|nr:hypothetical protein [Clostridia bacterium]
MKALGKILSFLFGLIWKLIVLVFAMCFGTLYAIAVHVIAALLIAIPVNLLYAAITPDFHQYALPLIAYWTWFKIILVIRLLIDGLQNNANKKDVSELKEQFKSKRTKPLTKE